jgi:hypothetical protein
MLTPFDPDWRWLLHRSDSPWYPTMRLIRQTSRRNWNSISMALADSQSPIPDFRQEQAARMRNPIIQ